MKNGWFDRLVEVIEETKVSKRALSATIGRGPNFIQQMIKDGKEPGADKLATLLDRFTEADGIYIMIGVRLSQPDLKMIKSLGDLDQKTRTNALRLFADLAENEDTPLPAS